MAIDVVLKCKSFEDGGLIKPEEVGIGDSAKFWSDFEVHPGIQESDTGIYEIALSLKFAAAEVCEEAFALGEINAEEFDLLALPEAELSTGEIWIVKNGVKAFGLLVIGVIISGGPESGGAEANPVSINREFDGAHVGADISGLSLNGVETIATSDVIEGVTDVDFVNMAIAGESEVISIDFVRAKDADGIRPDKKVIAIEFNAWLVVVVVKAELCGVTRKDEVLSEVVEDDGILVAVIKGVQQAVCVFFGLVKPNHIELISVGQSCAKESDSAVGVCKDKTSKVAHERLRAGSDGEEVVIRTEVGKFRFDEPFFECGMVFPSCGSVANVRINNSKFIDIEVIQVEHRSESNLPVEWFETSIAMGKVELKLQIIDEEILLRISVEFRLPWVNGALEGTRGNGSVPKFMEHEVNGGDIQKRVLSDNGIVTFENILVVRVPPMPFFEGLVDTAGIGLFVALPIRKACSPTVFYGNKVEALLGFAGPDSRGAGVARWRANEWSDKFGGVRRWNKFAGNVIRRRCVEDFRELSGVGW